MVVSSSSGLSKLQVALGCAMVLAVCCIASITGAVCYRKHKNGKAWDPDAAPDGTKVEGKVGKVGREPDAKYDDKGFRIYGMQHKTEEGDLEKGKGGDDINEARQRVLEAQRLYDLAVKQQRQREGEPEPEPEPEPVLYDDQGFRVYQTGGKPSRKTQQREPKRQEAVPPSRSQRSHSTATQLSETHEKLAMLEKNKLAAVELEDYDLAAKFKRQINTLTADLERQQQQQQQQMTVQQTPPRPGTPTRIVKHTITSGDMEQHDTRQPSQSAPTKTSGSVRCTPLTITTRLLWVTYILIGKL